MASNEYHFITHWHVESTIREVSEILDDAVGLMRWWPSVYLDVKVLKAGDSRGIGREISLYTKGFLPYTLRWDFVLAEMGEKTFTIKTQGDFVGRGIWTFEQDGPWVNITYDWKISAEKPILKRLSVVLKPIFKANHLWAMSKGEESLRLELARRHAKTVEERARIAAPPPATTTSPIPLMLGAGTVTAASAGLIYWLVRLIVK
jgi:hypothetical protein